jgi:hypothetical protein
MSWGEIHDIDVLAVLSGYLCQFTGAESQQSGKKRLLFTCIHSLVVVASPKLLPFSPGNSRRGRLPVYPLGTTTWSPLQGHHPGQVLKVLSSEITKNLPTYLIEPPSIELGGNAKQANERVSSPPPNLIPTTHDYLDPKLPKHSHSNSNPFPLQSGPLSNT